ncbi:MAG: molybdopterin-guanine dinucleotide biosynthesis protein B [Desulfuromusa sp.]
MKATRAVKAVSFAAKSGTGKTTLVEKLITELQTRGYRIGAFKAVPHQFDIDQPGKDSYRMAAAGAEATMICSAEKLAFVQTLAEPPDIETLLNDYFQAVDLVLVEGYKQGPLPKIEVFRQGHGESLLCCDGVYNPTYIAVASDCQLDLEIPVLNLNDPATIADFLVEKFLSN